MESLATPDYSIVIPVYKAEGCLEELYRRIAATMAGAKLSYEVIFVEDCGGDASWQKIVKIAEKDSAVTGLKLSRNFGQHHAITAGLDAAIGNRVIIMDCDLQDRPEDIPVLCTKADEGYDVVVACWKARNDQMWKKVLSIGFYKTFSWMSGYTYDPGTRAFRLLSRKAAESLKSMREQMRSLAPLNTWIGFDTAAVYLEPGRRLEGKSSYHPLRLLRLATTNIVAFSDKPLKFSIWLGFGVSLFAFLYGVFSWIRAAATGSELSEFSALAASIYFIGGVLLAFMGVQGVYIARIFDETKRRPLYIVAKTTKQSSQTA